MDETKNILKVQFEGSDGEDDIIIVRVNRPEHCHQTCECVYDNSNASTEKNMDIKSHNVGQFDCCCTKMAN